MSFWLEVKNRHNGKRELNKELPDPASGRVGPYMLRDWAEREGLEIEYIDNCHVKVPVDREKLLALLTKLYGPEHPLLASVVPILPTECDFVLEAEEF